MEYYKITRQNKTKLKPLDLKKPKTKIIKHRSINIEKESNQMPQIHTIPTEHSEIKLTNQSKIKPLNKGKASRETAHNHKRNVSQHQNLLEERKENQLDYLQSLVSKLTRFKLKKQKITQKSIQDNSFTVASSLLPLNDLKLSQQPMKAKDILDPQFYQNRHQLQIDLKKNASRYILKKNQLGHERQDQLNQENKSNQSQEIKPFRMKQLLDVKIIGCLSQSLDIKQLNYKEFISKMQNNNNHEMSFLKTNRDNYTQQKIRRRASTISFQNNLNEKEAIELTKEINLVNSQNEKEDNQKERTNLLERQNQNNPNYKIQQKLNGEDALLQKFVTYEKIQKE